MNDIIIVEVKKGIEAKLQARINKLNARARRLNVPPVILEQLSSWTPRFHQVVDEIGVAQNVHDGDFAFWGVTIEIPRLQGWTFIATIEHAGAAGNMIHKAPTPEGTPELNIEAYRHTSNFCDHCRKPRNRKDTYVIRHEDGRTMQVGKDCLCDVIGLGATPESIAAWAEWLSHLSRTGGGWVSESDYDDEGCGQRDPFVSTPTFVAYSVAVIAKQGFISRKNAGMGQNPTVEDVWYNLEPPRGLTSRQRAELIKPTEKDFAKAQTILEWAKQIDPLTDFDHNMRCLASQKLMDRRNGGLAAYLPIAYSRALERETERQLKAAASPSKHVGEIGKRIKGQTLTYISTPWSGETDYGMRYIHRFTTEDGSQIVWKTGTDMAEDPGTSFEADFTPKAHVVFNGILQTEVLRVKLETA